MTVVDNSLQELASSVTRGYTGTRGTPELIRRSNGRLHQNQGELLTDALAPANAHYRHTTDN